PGQRVAENRAAGFSDAHPEQAGIQLCLVERFATAFTPGCGTSVAERGRDGCGTATLRRSRRESAAERGVSVQPPDADAGHPSASKHRAGLLPLAGMEQPGLSDEAGPFLRVR